VIFEAAPKSRNIQERRLAVAMKTSTTTLRAFPPHPPRLTKEQGAFNTRKGIENES
jgi:hypothetical protein